MSVRLPVQITAERDNVAFGPLSGRAPCRGVTLTAIRVPHGRFARGPLLIMMGDPPLKCHVRRSQDKAGQNYAQAEIGKDSGEKPRITHGTGHGGAASLFVRLDL